MHTSFAPKDAGQGRWEGGQATITNPRFEYRSVDFGTGSEKLVTLHIDYLDRDGGEHLAKFDVGNTMTRAGDAILVIRDSADDGADEAEIGPSFSHIDADKRYQYSPKSEFGIFMTSLVGVAGFSESKLEGGDITVLDGLEVIVTPKAKKEGDKWPLMVVTELIDKKKKSTVASSKPTTATAKKPTAAAAAEPVDESGDLDPTTEAARDLVIELVADNEGPVKIGKLVTSAMAKFKGDKKLSAAVVQLIQQADFHQQFSGFWKYDPKAKQVSEVG
jgi:hypothetical protein